MRNANDIPPAPITGPADMNILSLCIHVQCDHSLKLSGAVCDRVICTDRDTKMPLDA